MDYKLCYLAIGMLIVLIILKNNKCYIDNKIGISNNINNENNENDKNNVEGFKIRKKEKFNENNNSNIEKLTKENEKLRRQNKNMGSNLEELRKEITKGTEYGDESINKYNKSLENYIEYQNSQKGKIDLLTIGKDIEDGIFELTDNFNNTRKNSDIFNGQFKEGFAINTKNKPTIFNILKKEVKNKTNINKKDKTDTPIVLEQLKKEISNEKTEYDENDKGEFDERIIDYLKYIGTTIYNLFKQYFSKYMNKNNTFNIDNLTNISKENNT